ncbi:MOSC domain-containing protein [Pontixanthobacter aquaemixtae]|uniref:MOSC domain-containing protein n=1 Tax=Pontixanthobacter aquaemixtae TaxID=1958940 RepID=UPI0038B4995E
MIAPSVIAVAKDGTHRFSKEVVEEITIRAGLGVEGDAHAGETVQHLSRVAVDPMQPNLRQIHLIHTELFDELRGKGYDIASGDLGENITTRGIDLLGLSRDTLLHIGESAVLRVTGLRNPCKQIENFRTGLLGEMVEKSPEGLIRKAGIMSVVVADGVIRAGDAICVEATGRGHIPLERV